MNKVFIIGNLTRDPELRSTNSGAKVCSFTVAVNRRKKQDGTQDTDFIQVQAWQTLAEICTKYLVKGRKVAVDGEIRTGSYEKDGHKVYTTNVLASNIEFLSSGSNSASTINSNLAADPTTGEVLEGSDANGPSGGFTQVADDDLPF